MKYKYYNIYETPTTPTAKGKYIGVLPIFEQALTVCENAKKSGKSYFIKGVCSDGTEIIIL